MEWAQAGPFSLTYSSVILYCDLKTFLKNWVPVDVDANWISISWNLICQHLASYFR